MKYLMLRGGSGVRPSCLPNDGGPITPFPIGDPVISFDPIKPVIPPIFCPGYCELPCMKNFPMA